MGKKQTKTPPKTVLRCSEIRLTTETPDGKVTGEFLVPARFFILDDDNEKRVLNKSKELLNLAAHRVGIAYGKWSKT